MKTNFALIATSLTASIFFSSPTFAVAQYNPSDFTGATPAQVKAIFSLSVKHSIPSVPSASDLAFFKMITPDIEKIVANDKDGKTSIHTSTGLKGELARQN